MISKEYIEEAIKKTIAGESNLTKDSFKVRGFSSKRFRMLINNLTNCESTYLEVGLLCGATFCSSFNANCLSVGIEDYSQNFQADIPGYNKEELDANIEKFRDRAKEIHVHYESFLEIDKSKLPAGIDIYCYDGEHGIECSSVSLPEFFDNMADTFLFILDDTNYKEVTDGAGVGFKFLRNKMWLEKTWELKGKKWGNGINLYLISKKK